VDPESESETGEEYMLRTSFLTLGGYDERDYTGDIAWFETQDTTWNQTATDFKFAGQSILDKETQVMFETGYPYIGLSNETYDKVAAVLERDISGMECTTGRHWGVCRV